MDSLSSNDLDMAYYAAALTRPDRLHTETIGGRAVEYVHLSPRATIIACEQGMLTVDLLTVLRLDTHHPIELDGRSTWWMTPERRARIRVGISDAWREVLRRQRAARDFRHRHHPHQPPQRVVLVENDAWELT